MDESPAAFNQALDLKKAAAATTIRTISQTLGIACAPNLRTISLSITAMPPRLAQAARVSLRPTEVPKRAAGTSTKWPLAYGWEGAR